MNVNAPTKKILALAALAGAAGCTTTYSQLDGYRWYRAPIDTHPVIVSKVDGRSTALSAPVQVEPGPHQVAVQTYPSPLDPLGTEKTIAIDVKPCTHYYLVAVKPNRLQRDFDIRVDYEEPVPGCSAPAAR
jgi:hypothetical protein